jgi:hypothetical protein
VPSKKPTPPKKNYGLVQRGLAEINPKTGKLRSTGKRAGLINYILKYKQKNPKKGNPIIGALADPKPAIRYAALRELQKQENCPPEATKKLIALANNPEPRVRETVAELLGRIGTPEVIPTIKKLKSDKEIAVAGSARTAHDKIRISKIKSAVRKRVEELDPKKGLRKEHHNTQNTLMQKRAQALKKIKTGTLAERTKAAIDLGGDIYRFEKFKERQQKSAPNITRVIEQTLTEVSTNDPSVIVRTAAKRTLNAIKKMN